MDKPCRIDGIRKAKVTPVFEATVSHPTVELAQRRESKPLHHAKLEKHASAARVQRFVRRVYMRKRIYGRGICFVRSATNFWSIVFPPSFSAWLIFFQAPR